MITNNKDIIPSVKKSFIKFFLAASLLSPAVNSVSAKESDYSSEPKSFLADAKEMREEDDETFYAVAKEKLSSEAYSYLSGEVADSLASSGGISFVSSSSDLVDLLKEEMERYNTKEGGAKDDGHFYRKDFYQNSDSGQNAKPWCGVFMSYMCYTKFGLFSRSKAIKGNLALAANWKPFFQKNSKLGTFFSPGAEIKAGDILVWDHHVGMAIGGDRFISGNYSDTVKEGSISSENKAHAFLGSVRLKLTTSIKGDDGKAVMQIFMKNGYSGAAAAGIAGNLAQETGGRTFKYNPAADDSSGFGIFQMTDSRRASMISWLKANGYEKSSTLGQCLYMIKVDADRQYTTGRTSSSHLAKYGVTVKISSASDYKKMTDPKQAARVWAAIVERCSSGYRGHLSTRSEMAQVAYEKWGKDSSSAS